MTEPITKVVLRRWNVEYGTPNGYTEVIALFPEIAANFNPDHCLSYQRFGQHGAAHYDHIIRYSKHEPSTAPEADALLTELRTLGYNLKVIQRAGPDAYEKRRQQINAMTVTGAKSRGPKCRD